MREHHSFWTIFLNSCPEVTLCGWQDVKIQELTSFLNSSLFIFSFSVYEPHTKDSLFQFWTDWLHESAVQDIYFCYLWSGVWLSDADEMYNVFVSDIQPF